MLHLQNFAYSGFFPHQVLLWKLLWSQNPKLVWVGSDLSNQLFLTPLHGEGHGQGQDSEKRATWQNIMNPRRVEVGKDIRRFCCAVSSNQYQIKSFAGLTLLSSCPSYPALDTTLQLCIPEVCDVERTLPLTVLFPKAAFGHMFSFVFTRTPRSLPAAKLPSTHAVPSRRWIFFSPLEELSTSYCWISWDSHWKSCKKGGLIYFFPVNKSVA